MDSDNQRDMQEEAYWRDFCPGCGNSPCTEPEACHNIPIEARVKVVNPDSAFYERFGTVDVVDFAYHAPFLVSFSNGESEAFQAWELMEWPNYGTTPDSECGDCYDDALWDMTRREG